MKTTTAKIAAFLFFGWLYLIKDSVAVEVNEQDQFSVREVKGQYFQDFVLKELEMENWIFLCRELDAAKNLAFDWVTGGEPEDSRCYPIIPSKDLINVDYMVKMLASDFSDKIVREAVIGVIGKSGKSAKSNNQFLVIFSMYVVK